MYCKRLTIIIVLFFVMIILGCSNIEQIIYHPDINQGNYFDINKLDMIYPGMTKKQVSTILGDPIMTNPFNNNTWFYLFRKKILKNKKIIQYNLILTFNRKDILININNKSILYNK